MTRRFQVPPYYSIWLTLTVVSLLWSAGCGGSSSSVPPPTKLPPTITKAFGAASVALNGSTTLTFTLSNPNSSLSLSGIGFSDTMPSGLIVSSPNGLTGTCGGGTITAAGGSASVSLSGATLASATSCTFTVNVVGTTAGAQNNVTSAVTSTEAGNGGTASAQITVVGPSQQPTEPTDISPINGNVYYVLNQLSGLQADLNNNSTTAGDHIVQQPRTFTNLSQRWAFTKLPSGSWQISNILNNLCFDSATQAGVVYVVQNPCAGNSTQQWTLTATSNGYYTITNNSTGLMTDVPSASSGAFLAQTALSGSATQSQQWLLRPANFRGVDNALLEKQEAARIATGLVWWKDTSGTETDVLQILKNHGVNMVRVRPASAPPYSDPSEAGCTANECFEETEAQDLDLAKRTKNLGLSLELTLFFDGGGSGSGNPPPAWAGHTLSQLQTDVHDYVKAEILLYRQQGTMPDLVSIGNEVNNGFLTGVGNVTGSNFSDFASLQKAGMQGVMDAAADTSMGPAIPAPLTCIHITPQWPMTDFFTRVNSNSVPYDAICQSYYPIFHGPLLTTQSNPNGQPVEETVLNAATSLGKPIFIIETGEHYENGSQSNDLWYAPPSPTLQAQFLRDLDGVQKALPDNLGMGIAYWNPAGVDIPRLTGGLFNEDANLPDEIFVWNGLTIFDNADSSGSVNVSDPNYSTPLPALDALGGKP